MRFTTTQMLRHLVDFSSRSIRLELMKPLIQENDFTKVHKGPDGGLIIENARFKTRVRASTVDPVRRSDIASGNITCIWTLINRHGWSSTWRMGTSLQQGLSVLMGVVLRHLRLRDRVLQAVSLVS
jgi:hypothetical protein